MPRDLDLSGDVKEDRVDHNQASPPTLSESPNRISGPSSPEPSRAFTIVPPDQVYAFSRGSGRLHPYVRPLTVSDLESCCALENAAFVNEEERASWEKFQYRLTKCGELCLGIFCTVDKEKESDIKHKYATFDTAKLVETDRRNGAVSVMLGHVVSSKTSSLTCTDDSMNFPSDWQAASLASTKIGFLKGESEVEGAGKIGHEEHGRTIVLHSVAIAPGFQGRGLGGVLMKSYVAQMSGAGVADRLVLLAHAEKVEWYEKLGFVNKGPSAVQFGGGNWIDMEYSLKRPEHRARYG